jgi:hypothetical protein
MCWKGGVGLESEICWEGGVMRPRTLAAPSCRGYAVRLWPLGAAGDAVADLGRAV